MSVRSDKLETQLWTWVPAKSIGGRIMSFKVRCPNPACLKAYSVSDNAIGKMVRCRNCGSQFKAEPSPDDSTGAKSAAAEAPQHPDVFCGMCAAAVAPGARFCSSCGLPLEG